ncbi:hypothetical protein P22_0494 [Propionispora sp. 2/2-37]|uniref:motility associated factor glycosyltransferase family protein n=1 Tax=Propionispora sp. 2/2-37 TaxID=1677858 RepID=UPI0006BB63EF|nr:6-hydroxymethylpterin diphosphokinase MptE-like protein [Propionispora sp. 2/2-37]CUH94428.1 hypothetical protein P22_0494 [Propionispora sp. 2/2-37]
MSSEILRSNLEAIGQHSFFVLAELNQIDFTKIGDGIYEEVAANDQRNVYFQHDGKKYLLHSSYDPVMEAKRLVRDIEKERDYLVVVFGLGLGFHLFELKERISPGTRVVVVEHNLDVAKYTLNYVDLTEVFKDGQFVLLLGDEQQIAKMALVLPQFNFHNLLHNTQVMVLPNYHIYAEKNKAILRQISKSMLNTVMSFGNDLTDQFVGFGNMCHNTDAIMKAHSIEDIRGKYKDVPAVIVAAGPSLDKNIRQLKKANGKALIIACDASMRACEQNGVRPDAVASIERDEPTYTFYYKDRKFPEDLVLVGPGSLWPNIYDEYEGKTIIMSRNNCGFEKIWLDTFKQFKFVGLGHSCATVAFTVAREAGCNPIVLIGQDLAYTSGKKHSDLTHTEHEGENDDRDSTEGVYLEDHEGNLLKSHIVYKMFKEWYEMQVASYPDLQVIDATEGGAYIKGTVLMTLQEVIDKYCRTSIGKRMVDYLPDKTVNEAERLQKYGNVINILNRDLTLLKRVQKLALEHMKMLIRMEQQLVKPCTDKQLEKMIIKMQQGDKIIRKIVDANGIEAYFAPMIIPTIMHVKKIGNALTQENVQRNRFLQHNLMFVIVNSIDLIVKEYNNAKGILEQKRQQITDEQEEEKPCAILS